MRIRLFFMMLASSAFLSACGGSEDSSLIEKNESSGAVETTEPTEVAFSPLERALATGDISHISEDGSLLDAALESIESDRTLMDDAFAQILNLDPEGGPESDGPSTGYIDWDPTHDAALLESSFGNNAPILRTNSVTNNSYDVQDLAIGIIGKTPAKNMVLGSNPMRNYRRDNTSLNDGMHQFLMNSVAWLQDKDNGFSSSFNVVIAQMANSYYFPDEPAVREWLDEKFPGQITYNTENACDDAELENCLQALPDLLIISQVATEDTDVTSVVEAVTRAMSRGTPVMYLHHNGDLTSLGGELLAILNTGYAGDNYWQRLALSGFDTSAISGILPAEITALQRTLTHFKNKDFAFDWSQCNSENCDAVEGLDTDFFEAADYLRDTLQNLDLNKIDIFKTDSLRLNRLMVLLGDFYRQSVRYPMDKLSTDDTLLMQALFADYSVHHYRQFDFSPPLIDLGNFSRSDFSHINPVSKSIEVQGKRNFRAAGVYALPGKTFSVKRTDNSDIAVKISVNTQRSGSTHLWETDGYSRPKFLKSPSIAILPNETIRMSSPYGGPIQLSFDENDLPISLAFDNIGLHPYWKNSADDAKFSEQVAASDYDWAEISTPGFEVHSTLAKMQESMIDPALDQNLPPAQAISAATMRYVHNFPHVLAGFKGPGIDIVAEIHDFAANHHLTVDNLDLVKHMNADQATCGYGCSGNPYDAYWAFSPVGHGDIHEMGHGLEKYRLRFNGWETHTMTNMYSYYTKSQFYIDTGKEPNCQGLPFENAYNILKNSLTTADPAAYVKTQLWDSMGWAEGAAMFVQLMMSAEDNTALVSGWHLLSRLHLLEREFARATSTDDATWQAQRSNFGMDLYTLSEAESLDQNDWLLIAISLATGLDHREYFDVWSLNYSTEAAAQVQALSFPMKPVNFYVSSATGYCKGEGFDGQKLPLDGSNANWPLTE